MAIIFVDKNARTVLVRAQRREAVASSSSNTLPAKDGPTADEIVFDLLSKVPSSEFIRLPTKISED